MGLQGAFPNICHALGKAQIDNMFNRDKTGQVDPAIVQWLVKFEMKFGDSIPAGTYIDMAINLPQPPGHRIALLLKSASNDTRHGPGLRSLAA